MVATHAGGQAFRLGIIKPVKIVFEIILIVRIAARPHIRIAHPRLARRNFTLLLQLLPPHTTLIHVVTSSLLKICSNEN
jgi:hypothetical protein